MTYDEIDLTDYSMNVLRHYSTTVQKTPRAICKEREDNDSALTRFARQSELLAKHGFLIRKQEGKFKRDHAYLSNQFEMEFAA